MTSHKTLKTGSDPRTFAEYAALRDEMSKLTHPARPDVNWGYAEKLSLSLFEQNGVELQTAAWYTLARTQLAGLYGLNEGLAILEAMISHQWGVFWPQPVHVRMEILSGLSQRLQQRVRTLSLSGSDLSKLYRAEQMLIRLEAVLQRLELKHLSQLEALRVLLHNNAVRLEKDAGTSDPDAAVEADPLLPASGMSGGGASGENLPGQDSSPENMAKWVYVVEPEYQANVDVLTAMPAQINKWKFFAAGACSMVVLCVAAVWGWHTVNRPDPIQTELAASLAPLPATLTPAQLGALQKQSLPPKALIAQTQQQLARLDKLPPDWSINYGRQLIGQAQTLWPEQAKPLTQQWQQQISVSALPADAMNGWHDGMTQLQTLAGKLNALDGHKGKYITVSELKSLVFGMMISFQQTVPMEERLRLLKQLPANSPLYQQQLRQAEQHLRAQTYTLSQEKYRD